MRDRIRYADVLRAGAASIAVAGLMFSLSGCSFTLGLPVSGPVQRLSQVQRENSRVYIDPSGPSAGAEPESIVSGFIAALPAGPQRDGFKVAREFLTANAAANWQSDAETIVYSGEPSVTRQAGTLDLSTQRSSRVSVVVSYKAVGHLDTHGVYSVQADRSSGTLTFKLDKVDGQWRIASLPNGILISSVDFQQTYRQVQLYQRASSSKTLVPDNRWLSWRQWRTLAVNELIRGAASYLGRAVSPVVDDNTSMHVDSVPVNNDGKTEVKLSDTSSMSESDLAMLVHQIRLTLGDGSPDYEIQVTDASGADLSHVDDGIDLAVNQPSMRLYSLSNSAIVSIASSNLIRLGEVGGAGIQAKGMAFSSSGGAVLREDGVAECIDQSVKSCGMMFDGRQISVIAGGLDGEVWAVPKDSGVLLVSHDGKTSSFETPWLEGYHVTGMAVSPEGSRLTVAASSADGRQGGVFMLGIQRKSNDAVVHLADSPICVSAQSDISAITFYNESTLVYAIRNAAGGYQQIAPGPQSVQTLPKNTVGLAAGLFDQTQSLFSMDGNGQIRCARGALTSSWRTVDFQSNAISSGR